MSSMHLGLYWVLKVNWPDDILCFKGVPLNFFFWKVYFDVNNLVLKILSAVIENDLCSFPIHDKIMIHSIFEQNTGETLPIQTSWAEMILKKKKKNLKERFHTKLVA